MFGGLDPRIKQEMKVGTSCLHTTGKNPLSDLLSFNGKRKMQLYFSIFLSNMWHEALMPILLPCCRISANK
jgi:hypothetical protein